ncbi:hypothetical protein YB2330_001032 [Saitoella coloradoensis]
MESPWADDEGGFSTADVWSRSATAAGTGEIEGAVSDWTTAEEDVMAREENGWAGPGVHDGDQDLKDMDGRDTGDATLEAETWTGPDETNEKDLDGWGFQGEEETDGTHPVEREQLTSEENKDKPVNKPPGPDAEHALPIQDNSVRTGDTPVAQEEDEDDDDFGDFNSETANESFEDFIPAPALFAPDPRPAELEFSLPITALLAEIFPTLSEGPVEPPEPPLSKTSSRSLWYRLTTVHYDRAPPKWTGSNIKTECERIVDGWRRVRGMNGQLGGNVGGGMGIGHGWNDVPTPALVGHGRRRSMTTAPAPVQALRKQLQPRVPNVPVLQDLQEKEAETMQRTASSPPAVGDGEVDEWEWGSIEEVVVPKREEDITRKREEPGGEQLTKREVILLATATKQQHVVPPGSSSLFDLGQLDLLGSGSSRLTVPSISRSIHAPILAPAPVPLPSPQMSAKRQTPPPLAPILTDETHKSKPPPPPVSIPASASISSLIPQLTNSIPQPIQPMFQPVISSDIQAPPSTSSDPWDFSIFDKPAPVAPVAPTSPPPPPAASSTRKSPSILQFRSKTEEEEHRIMEEVIGKLPDIAWLLD